MRIVGWLFLVACCAAVGLFFGMSPQIAFYIAFLTLALNFATFCLQYDDPIKRARNRTEQQLQQISSKGVHAEEYQRLQSRKVVANVDDHRFRLTAISGLNIASGITGIALVCWGIVARTLTT